MHVHSELLFQWIPHMGKTLALPEDVTIGGVHCTCRRILGLPYILNEGEGERSPSCLSTSLSIPICSLINLSESTLAAMFEHPMP